MQRGFHHDLLQLTTSAALCHSILLRSTNSRWSAAPREGFARIACPNIDDWVVICGLRDRELIRGWVLTITRMTKEQLSIVLDEIVKNRMLQKAAVRAGLRGADAEDAAHDALEIIAGLGPERYANINDLKFYALKIVRRRAVELLEEIHSISTPIGITDSEPEAASDDNSASPYESYAIEQMRQRLHEALETLDPLESAATRARLDEESGRELAERNQLRPGAVRRARERGIRKLSTLFRDLIRPGSRRDRDDQ